jgi:predicted GIY-YIG superfamily endonuclease
MTDGSPWTWDWSVYLLIDPITKSVRYAGMTRSIRHRIREHLYTSSHHKEKDDWIKFLRKRKLKPDVIVLHVCDTRKEASDVEKHVIETMSSYGYNLFNRLHTRGYKNPRVFKSSKDKKEFRVPS